MSFFLGQMVFLSVCSFFFFFFFPTFTLCLSGFSSDASDYGGDYGDDSHANANVGSDGEGAASFAVDSALVPELHQRGRGPDLSGARPKRAVRRRVAPDSDVSGVG